MREELHPRIDLAPIRLETHAAENIGRKRRRGRGGGHIGPRRGDRVRRFGKRLNGLTDGWERSRRRKPD